MAEASTTPANGQKSSSNSETTECPICLQKVNKPKYLPCLHTFCESCLQTYITSVTEIEKALENFECPVCRRPVKPPEGGQLISEWARLFPTNHLIKSLRKSTEQLSEIHCTVCEGQEKETKAKFKCAECAEALCNHCKRWHDSFRFLQNHRAITLEGGEPEENIMCFSDQDSCYLHTGKCIDRYCYDHKRVCCSICFVTEHRHCERVEELDKIKTKMKKEYVEYDISVFAAMIFKIDEFIAQKEGKLTNLNAKQDEISDSLSAKVEEIKFLVHKLHTQFSKAFDLDHENIVYSTEQCIRDLRSLKSTLQNAIKVMKMVLERGSDKQVLMTIATLLQQLSAHFEKFRKANEADVDKEYDYDFRTLLEQMFENGKIKEITIKEHESKIVKVLSEDISKVCLLREELPETVPWVSQPNMDRSKVQVVTLHEQSLPQSVIACFLDEKNILVSCGYELRIYGTDGRRKNRMLPQFENLYDYSYIQNGQYADELVMSIGTKVNTYRISNTTKPILINEIDLKETVEGFCFCKDVIISVTRSTVKIYRYTPDVSILFSTEESRVGEIGYVAASKAKEKFAYVTGNEVVCRTSDGTEAFRYRNEKLKSPRGIAFDYCDNIYVCTTCFDSTWQRGWTQETGGGVIQVMNNGSTGRIFISDYRNACFINFCSNGELFLVSDTSKYTFYKLSKVKK